MTAIPLRRFVRVVLACGWLGAGGVSLAAAQIGAPVPQLTVGRPAEGERPVVDGRVDEAVWARAEPFSAFIQQEPNEGEPATERTEIRFLVDRQNLSIAVVCFDSEPDKILVSQSRRDAPLNDTDSVQILLDTFNDGQNAFVFGTNPFGIEYDGQVTAEGQGGAQRGEGTGGINLNWDADWTVRTQRTERGWEAEFAIPLKTLRYNPGDERTWGVNVLRNVRRKNEQVFLSPVPRGYTLHRVSVAGKLHGLSLPARRDIRLLPYVAASVNDEKTLRTDTVDRNGDVGLDFKWGVRADLTLDVTVNTDFAQVEADEQQVNLTRFPLFFPEKRPFFLENAQLFQLGQAQAVDLFFSRRIGLSETGQPIDIVAGGRLSGKLGGGYNIGVLNMQTEAAVNDRLGQTLAPASNFTVARLQREVGRSNFGAMFVGRQGVGGRAPADDYNRAYGLDLGWQATTNGRLNAFLARTDSPRRKGGSDYAGRAAYLYVNELWGAGGAYTQVGDRFNPEVGFLRRRAYRSVEGRYNLSYQPKQWPWIRRIQPHTSFTVFTDLQNRLESSQGHWHFFDIMTRPGARFGYLFDSGQDRPRRPFTIYQDVTGRRVVIPAGQYAWIRGTFEGHTNLSAPISAMLWHRVGSYYNGDYHGWDLTVALRAGARLLSEIGWKRDDITLPGGSFRNDLVPMKISYAFTSLASLQGLIQYNKQASTLSSNIRLALLNRSGTGFFLVYNDRRDTSDFTPDELLGRSFIVKYTRLFDY
ncbi:MAG: carbohydrate binding family 9 domain-containing protein [Acidobacteria bacterium]|nr:carbohydrate binding family 9 domain-containing protein [Acidobacteriota bacterium]